MFIKRTFVHELCLSILILVLFLYVMFMHLLLCEGMKEIKVYAI